MSVVPSVPPLYRVHPWRVIESAFDPARYRTGEAVFALANGYLGSRASCEEGAPGVETLRGNYIAGVFDAYPNPTMIRLKGRPAAPRQMVNIPDYLSIELLVDGEAVSPATSTVTDYTRTLHLDRGVLTREMTLTTPLGRRVRCAFTRFLSRPRRHLAALQVTVTLLDRPGTIEFRSAVDGTVRNANFQHLTEVAPVRASAWHGVQCRTTNTDIDIVVLATEMTSGPAHGGPADADGISCQQVCVEARVDCPVSLEKLVAVATSRDGEIAETPLALCAATLAAAAAVGFPGLLAEQEAAWADVWRTTDIRIADRSGSEALTQGLRYSLYQMLQNAAVDDPTVNIGAKGLTGEHYFGTYFWDTEAFMLPMFGLTAPAVAHSLVQFRAHTLPGAREKARELDCAGAAFPFMADADGRENCTLWQFGLLGIHVTAAVAWGVWFYYCTTGDLDFVADGGIDILVETSRFWVSRVYHRADLGRYVINRVLGPDEYHQGVDNNFYTNIMAQENLLKCVRLLDILAEERPAAYQAAYTRLGLTDDEVEEFRAVGAGIYLPADAAHGIHLQDDRFLALEPYDLQAQPLPGAVNAIWSYDRALRTQLLRQADVLVAHVLVGDRFTADELRRDYDYYEPKTTHDSSLSFCTHSVVAAGLGKVEEAYDYFLRTARLDLDDLHGNTWMGIHTANLAGAWQCVVLGFGGVRWFDGSLSLTPVLPPQWDEFAFTLWWHGVCLSVTVRAGAVELATDGGTIELTVAGQPVTAGAEMVRVATG
jgi:trehalose/maltose hydrolase-like predicted phosphorylase